MVAASTAGVMYVGGRKDRNWLGLSLALNCTQVRRVRCEASGVLVAKDKAIKRFIVRKCWGWAWPGALLLPDPGTMARGEGPAAKLTP